MPVEVLTTSEPITPPKSGAAGDDVAARRAVLHERAAYADRESAANKIDLTAATREPGETREFIDTIEVQTPAGLIVFGPPRGVSMTMRIATMLGEANPNRLQSVMLRVLMCVQSIDGRMVTPVTNMTEAQYLANQIGDATIDFLYVQYLETWPAPGAGELQVLRKNKRVT